MLLIKTTERHTAKKKKILTKSGSIQRQSKEL